MAAMTAMTAAQRKKKERQRYKDAGLITWKVTIDNATRDSLKLLTTAFGTGSQKKTFLKLIDDALDRQAITAIADHSGVSTVALPVQSCD